MKEKVFVSYKHVDSRFSSVIDNLISNMVHVEGGTFSMGTTPEQEDNLWDDDETVHEVTLSSFSIGRYPVTQEEWVAVMCSNPSEFKGSKRLVECVNWDDCQEFINKLNEMTGMKFRLPTDAEWEYAARGGNNSKGCKYSGSDILDEVAWYYENSGAMRLDEDEDEYNDGDELLYICETHPVGQKSPNELGLYDMSGNVDEWCNDWYHEFDASSQTNPKGPKLGKNKIFRGGNWSNPSRLCRVSSRDADSPDDNLNFIGFRLAL